MADIQHPAAGEELAHLDETKQTITLLQELGQKELMSSTAKLNEARRFDPDNLPLREMMYARAVQHVRNMELAMLRPYFTRINFIEESGEKNVYYIGKYGLMTPDYRDVVVVDWRSPVANLYYSGQVGPMHYIAPDGEVRGELTLKRQLGIENGQLQTIFDTDVVSQDVYLQSVLGATTGERLKEIVTSIQAEQNFVIRHPMNVSLVVQGVAGSGKTTIALHRIAYLLYAFQEKLEPDHMLILAPNPLFLNFIAGVLPDLGVERVKQTTFLRFVGEWMGKLLPKVQESDPLESILNLPVEERERISTIAHVKGSLRMAEELNRWMDGFEQRFPRVGALKFGPVTVFTEEELAKHILVDQRPFPLSRRLTEFKKALTSRTKDAAQKIIDWLEQETDRRTEKIRNTLPPTEERRLKLVSLYHSRDQRIEEAKAKIKPFIKETMERFEELSPIRLYREFWQDMLTSEDEAMRIAAEESVEKLSGKTISMEDVAPLTLIAMRTHELPRLDIRHVVVDEAQDFSALEFHLIRKMTRNAPMTLVGDLMQGVRSYRGLTDWGEVTDGLFGGKAVMHHLVTSYRNTMEIMNTALRVADKRPVPGQQAAKPVLRHGPEPEFMNFASARDQAEKIAQIIRKWKDEGMSTIAVIDRTDAQLKALMKKLPEDIGARLLDVNGEEYAGGVTLAKAADVKGFEFDGVILADASEERFPDRELDARLLYVCLTRPLHRLACLYSGGISPLLGE